MNIHFEPDLVHQRQAIDSVCDLFRGQEVAGSVAAGSVLGDSSLFSPPYPAVVGNRLRLSPELLLANLRAVQEAHGLAASTTLDTRDFTVEMETGTGKTYVYLRTIHELHRRYHFNKFIIVVPSLAIREGVHKALRITEGHFRQLYDGSTADYFVYDSTRLGRVRSFALDSELQIMIITVGAINKRDINTLYREHETTGGRTPMSLISDCAPIVVVDEPQSVDGGLRGRGREALREMGALCTLRYSATHVDKHHMLYRLDAVDAYERRLVKRIEVASASVEHAVNRPYVRVLAVTGRRGVISATLELVVANQGAATLRQRAVRDGDDLRSLTGLEIYRGLHIGQISLVRGDRFVEVLHPRGAERLRVGDAWNDVDHTLVTRQMIRQTIREHLDKERRLLHRGVKVLSLFFVDSVGKYRQYDSNGSTVKGEYATIFEEEYRAQVALREFADLSAALGHPAVESVHDGYFSMDRKGAWSDTSETTQAGRAAAETAYRLIMRDKEALLSQETALRFLFSHSALREGWDNPNVFQVCVLRDVGAALARRQIIGRGLRLCVDQTGHRVRSEEVNLLTVVARESYEDFARSLQMEIEADTGLRFGVVTRSRFAAIPLGDEASRPDTLGEAASAALWDWLHRKGYLTSDGSMTPALRAALLTGDIAPAPDWAAQWPAVITLLRRLLGPPAVARADRRQVVAPRRDMLGDPDFQRLWDRIRHKTRYRLLFDPKRLLQNCAAELRSSPGVPGARLRWRKGDVEIGREGVATAGVSDGSPVTLRDETTPLPDILRELGSATDLSRRDIYDILVESGRLTDFPRNPRRFLEIATDAIQAGKRSTLVDGIKYERKGNGEAFSLSLFQTEVSHGYLGHNLLRVAKSVHHHVVYDSEVERRFALDLERHPLVRLYAKLPGWFQIPTPLGMYNPDWTVLVQKENGERHYFVVETKGSARAEDLRPTEQRKIECAREHFAAIRYEQDPAEYVVRESVASLFDGLEIE